MCNNEVTQKDLHDLLGIFEKRSFEAGPCEPGTLESNILNICECLFKLDYSLIELENANGQLSPRYPGRIFIPEYEHGHMASTLTAASISNGLTNGYSSGYGSGISCSGIGGNGSVSGSGNGSVNGSAGSGNGLGNGAGNGIHAYVTFANSTTMPPTSLQTHLQQMQQQQQPQQQQQLQPQQQNTIYEDLYDIGKVRELITMAKYARCRQRFAIPVIMYRGKYICRSATISVRPETYGRKVVDYAYDCLNGTNYAERAINDDENNDPTDDSLMNQINESSPFCYDEVIKSDILLLNALNVKTIVDLMVEKRKIKYFMAVSSSEKADPENHYEHFNILSLPYPGCEFFKKFRDNNYMAKNLQYNWKQTFNDAIISLPKAGPAHDLEICWDDYKKWDLVLITQNYLKAILKYIQEENSGLLIHCISGWDRTPLFISLVRLSLWADGLIHQSLNALQMAYFTLAYDWYLFGHQLPDRLKRGEEIMFFCFHVLKYITDDEFSVVEHRKRTKTSSSSGSSSVIVIKSDCCDDEPLKEDYILNFDQDSNDSFSNCSNCDMSIADNFFTSTTTTTATNPLTSRSPNPKRSRTSPISVPGASATRQRQESTSSNGSWQVVTDTGSIDSLMNGSYMMRFIAPQPDNGSVHSGNSNGYAAGGNSNGCVNNYGANTLNTAPFGIGICGNGSSNGSGSGSGNGSIGGSGGSGGGGSSSNSSGSSNGINNGFTLLQNVNATIREISSSAGNKTPSTLRKQRLNSVRAIFIQAYGKTIGLKFKEGSAMNLATFMGTLADQLF